MVHLKMDKGGQEMRGQPRMVLWHITLLGGTDIFKTGRPTNSGLLKATMSTILQENYFEYEQSFPELVVKCRAIN